LASSLPFGLFIRKSSLSEIEVLDIVNPLPAATLTEAGLAISTNFNQTQVPASGSFKVKVRGKHILANLGSPLAGLKLNFHELGGSQNIQVNMDFAQAEESLNNTGTEAVFVLDPTRDNLSNLRADKNYELSVSGPNGTSNRIGLSSLSSSDGGFGTFSVKNTPPPPASLPYDHYIYGAMGGRWILPQQTLPVNPNEFVGIYFNQPIQNLEVKIGPVTVPIVDVLRDLAVIGIPDDLPAGVHDVVIKASGQTLTLEQVVSKASEALPTYPEASPPPSANPGRYGQVRIFNLAADSEARVTLNGETVLSAQGGGDVNLSAAVGPDTPYPLLDQERNRFCFELTNHSGGYTYGFELGWVFQDIQGTAGQQNVLTANGEEDTRTGVVYSQCFNTHAFVRPMGLPYKDENGLVIGDSQPFWVKVFNLSPGTSMKVSSWSDPGRTVQASQDSDAFELGFDGDASERDSGFWVDDDGKRHFYETYNAGELQWRILNPEGAQASYGIELYRGIHLLYRFQDGLAGHWGANQNQTPYSAPEGSFRMPFFPNIHPPGGWNY